MREDCAACAFATRPLDGLPTHSEAIAHDRADRRAHFGDHLQSTEITKSILRANPDLKGIFGADEGSAIGVVNGVSELGRSDVVVIGYDPGAAQMDAIRSGLMAGAITQNPVGIGYETVAAAVAAIKGEAVPAEIDTGFYYYDANNIDDPEIAAVLYE